MSDQVKNFEDFFEAMRKKKWSKARSYVINNGAVGGGFQGETASGVQGGLRFDDCTRELERLLDAFTVGSVSNMKVTENGRVVKATYQVPITYNGGIFSYRGTPVTFSTRQIVAKVISTITFDANGKIEEMGNRLANEREVIKKLQDI